MVKVWVFFTAAFTILTVL